MHIKVNAIFEPAENGLINQILHCHIIKDCTFQRCPCKNKSSSLQHWPTTQKNNLIKQYTSDDLGMLSRRVLLKISSIANSNNHFCQFSRDASKELFCYYSTYSTSSAHSRRRLTRQNEILILFKQHRRTLHSVNHECNSTTHWFMTA